MELTLEGKVFPLVEATFGTIKKLISVFNIMSKEYDPNDPIVSDSALAQMTLLLSIATLKSIEELDGMKISFTELVAFTKVIPVYCGIVQELSPNVEPVQSPAVDQTVIAEVSQPTVGTDSTSTSAPVFPDGILSTSTTT